MRRLTTAVLLASAALAASPALAVATSSSDVYAGPFAVDAKARWARTGAESQLLTADGTSSLLPGGTPVWQSGQAYAFELTYSVATGTTTWSIDFNRNASFGAGETLSDTVAALAGKGFSYVNLLLTGSNAGSISAVSNFTINGTNFGQFSNATGSNTNFLYEDSSGLFGDLTVTGALTFTNNGGVSDERPRLYVSLGDPRTPVSAVPEPATWGMMLLGFGAVGFAARRRRTLVAA